MNELVTNGKNASQSDKPSQRARLLSKVQIYKTTQVLRENQLSAKRALVGKTR